MKHANMIARIFKSLHAVLTLRFSLRLSIHLSPSHSSPSNPHFISKQPRQPEATYPVLPRSRFVPPRQNTLSPFFSLLTTLLFCISPPSSLPLPLPLPLPPCSCESSSSSLANCLSPQTYTVNSVAPSTSREGHILSLECIRAQLDFRDAVASSVSINGVL